MREIMITVDFKENELSDGSVTTVRRGHLMNFVANEEEYDFKDEGQQSEMFTNVMLHCLNEFREFMKECKK